MIETTIQIEGVSLVEFFGVNNAKFDIIKKSFPKLRITNRGSTIKAAGNTEDIKLLTQKIAEIVSFLEDYGSITIQHLEETLAGIAPTNIPKGNEGLILYGPDSRVIKARTANQKKMVREIEKNDIMFAIGPAGTGKTYTAVALAVKYLKNKLVKRIILTRPAVEAGESLGFLPGDLKDKIDPYLRPLYDALDDMVQVNKLSFYMTNRIIEIAPLAYMRGRTLNDAFIILDEAQNATNSQLKMFLTRLGPSTKCIITGDLTQIDLPRHQHSGLRRSVNILKDIKGISYVKLDTSDVIRHKLVKKIIEAYESADAKAEAQRKERNSQIKDKMQNAKQ